MHMQYNHTFRLLRAGAKLNKMPGTHVLCRFLNLPFIIFILGLLVLFQKGGILDQ